MIMRMLFYFPYASLTKEHLPLLEVVALYFDKLSILDPVGASWATVGADHVARDAMTLLKDAGMKPQMNGHDVADLQEARRQRLERSAILRDDERARRELATALQREHEAQTFGEAKCPTISPHSQRAPDPRQHAAME